MFLYNEHIVELFRLLHKVKMFEGFLSAEKYTFNQ